MTANSLTYPLLHAATVLWGDGPSDTRAWLRTQPAAMPWLSQIDADRATIARAPADGSPYALLTERLELADDRHDDRARFIVSSFHAYAERGGSLGAAAKELLTVFFPDGASVVNDTHLGEAARVAAREAAMTADARVKLARFVVASEDGSTRTLLDEMLALNADATEVGRIWNERAALDADGRYASAQDLVVAKRRLITTVREILASFGRLAKLGAPNGLDATGVVKFHTLRDTWNEAVASATANAAARRAAAAGNGSPAVTPAGPATS